LSGFSKVIWKVNEMGTWKDVETETAKGVEMVIEKVHAMSPTTGVAI
jgi:hypothetical protein